MKHPVQTASGEQACAHIVTQPSGLTWAARPFLLLLAAVAVLPAAPPPDSGSWIWVLALGLIGMPHGAYDLPALRRISRDWPQTLVRFGWYTLVMGVSTLAILLAPEASVFAFLLLAAHHFGISDSIWTRARSPLNFFDHFAGSGHGLIAIMAPFAFKPEAAWLPFGRIISWATGQPSPSSAPIAALSMILLAAGFAIVLTATCIRHRSQTQLAEEWGTLLAMLLLSSVAPPLVSIGIYFMVVHASGHCLRALQPGSYTAKPGLANAIRVHIASLPLLIPSIAIVLAAATLFHLPMQDAIACSFILFCMVATLPHHLMWLGCFSPSPD